MDGWLNTIYKCNFLLPSVVNVLIACWTYRVIWPRFIKQKRIDNVSQNAKEVLITYIPAFEVQIKCLAKLQKEKNTGDLQQEHVKQQENTKYAVHQLRNMLQLVVHDTALNVGNLPSHQKNIEKHLRDWISNLEKSLAWEKPEHIPAAFKTINILVSDKSGMTKEGINNLNSFGDTFFRKLDELKEALRAIHYIQ